ncbi:dual specificity protein phosphatase 16 [Limosa lapponica baueri]|uniref:Dual specificity protein phosphatase 16 n=1 Tax=Limosa lapponica baueri TaxID=1758121 RepID=A0A2I0TJN7_LIMLA|nr:dual specificity protein phosphatase 16 [Limosa lapponica baueri]
MPESVKNELRIWQKPFAQRKAESLSGSPYAAKCGMFEHETDIIDRFPGGKNLRIAYQNLTRSYGLLPCRLEVCLKTIRTLASSIDRNLCLISISLCWPLYVDNLVSSCSAHLDFDFSVAFEYTAITSSQQIREGGGERGLIVVMADEMIRTQLIVTEKLVALLESGTEKLLLIDSRPFVEYNTSHILDAININCSKLMKRRLQQDKVLITELIQHSAKHKVGVIFLLYLAFV